MAVQPCMGWIPIKKKKKSNSDQDCKRGKNVVSTAITTTSTTLVVKTNIQPQVQ